MSKIIFIINRRFWLWKNANVSIVKGELTFEDKVIQKIIGIALEEVDGLLTVDGGFSRIYEIK
ncbi:Asp23/Gls24 family envelope stress response protein [Enterococcus faecalis]|uniref:Asp23/Gls24 family envelope stress response protein n=1 Tax=Enterococcus faecalis TaxID=1351 RepID=A0A974S7C4_ENTFL|nr:Asp23/Gls24 family envelope stress response protein [Enterococcus faecalis]